MDLINNGNGQNNLLQNELDSLENLFTPDELEGVSYKSSLVSNFYTGFDYKLAEKHHRHLSVITQAEHEWKPSS